MDKNCQVCNEKYDKSLKKVITCLECDYKSCLSCQRIFLLTISDIHCMNCRVIWKAEFINKNFPKTFLIGSLRKHIENIILSTEIGYMEETQILYEEQKIKREAREKIDKKVSEIKKIQDEINILNFRFNNPSLFVSVNIESEKDEKIIKGVPCPGSDCRGYLKNWKCPICNIKICHKCSDMVKEENSSNSSTPTDESHLCNEEDLKNVNYIMNNTKPCPKCYISITKINGCLEMFCTNCDTSFNWKTEKILLKGSHNPHLKEYLKKIEENEQKLSGENDTVEDKMVEIHFVPSQEKYSSESYNLCNLYYQLKNSSLNKIFKPKKDYDINLTERLSYLDKTISEDEFKRKIYINKNRNLYKKDVYNLVIELMIDIKNIFCIQQKIHRELTERFGKMFKQLSKEEKNSLKKEWNLLPYDEVFLEQISKLRSDFNDKSYIVSNLHKYKACYIISENFSELDTIGNLKKKDNKNKFGNSPDDLFNDYSSDE